MAFQKKERVGATIAGLVLSMALPLSPPSGLPTSEVAAGVRPKFSKPWLKSSKSKTSSVKSYPIPEGLEDELKADIQTEQTQPRNLQSELDALYSEQESATGPEAKPAKASQSVPTQTAGLRKSSSGTASEKSSSRFGGLFGRLFRRSKSDDTPAPSPQPSSPPSSAPAETAPEQFVPSDSFAEDLPAPLDPLDNAPVADVIIPPQPMPNLLPDIAFPDGTDFEPAGKTAASESGGADPFPLPPLPDGFEPTPKVATKPAAKPSPQPTLAADDLLLPPLPGLDSEFAAEVAETAAPTPAVTTAPVEEPAPLTAQQDTPENDAAPAENVRSEAAQALPPAPSAWREGTPVARGPQPRPSLTTQVEAAPQQPDAFSPPTEPAPLPPTMQGWRSRDGQPAVLQEPNTLNVPEEARPAELPPAQTADNSSAADKYRRIAERGDRTGFKGFCPVTLKDELELVDATPQFRSEFEGQFYYFSSVAAQQRFERDPLRYVPAQNGIDLVKYIEQGAEVPGRLDFAVWYQDRLFLFSDHETLEEFRAEPTRFVGEQ